MSSPTRHLSDEEYELEERLSDVASGGLRESTEPTFPTRQRSYSERSEHDYIVEDKPALSQLGYDIIDYLNKRDFGLIMKGVCNERAKKCYPVEEGDPEPIGERIVISEDGKRYIERSLEGKSCAIKQLFLSEETPSLPSGSDSEYSDSGSVYSRGSIHSSHSSDLEKQKNDPRIEAMIWSDLNHPNVAEIYDVMTVRDERLYIIMELMLRTLANWRDRLGELNKRICDLDFEYFMTALCEGLAYLHSKGVLHNDIHSENIMLINDAEGQVIAKYVDFGLSEKKMIPSPDDSMTQIVDPNFVGLYDIRDLGAVLRGLIVFVDFEYMDFGTATTAFVNALAEGEFTDMKVVIQELNQIKSLLPEESDDDE